jgi:hypothetical protein
MMINRMRRRLEGEAAQAALHMEQRINDAEREAEDVRLRDRQRTQRERSSFLRLMHQYHDEDMYDSPQPRRPHSL